MLINIYTAHNRGGPGIFGTRLKEELERRSIAAPADRRRVSIISGGTSVTSFNYVTSLQQQGVKVIQRLNGLYDTPPEQKTNLYNYWLKRIREVADGHVYQSRYAKALYNHWFGEVKDKPSAVIHNGVDTNKFRPRCRTELKKRVVFMTVGRFRPFKRAHESIRMLREFIDLTQWPAKLIFIGGIDRKYSDYLAQIVKEERLEDDVEFAPAVRHELMKFILPYADIFLYPSWADACPNSVVEAMACGLPVVCENSGGTPELASMQSIIDIGYEEEYGIKDRYELDGIPSIHTPDYTAMVADTVRHYKVKRILARTHAQQHLDIRKVASKYIKLAEEVYGTE